MSFARGIALTLALAARLAAQLPPEVQIDLYLLEARKAVEQQDFDGARKALERLYSLETMPGLAHPEAFYFRSAQVSRQAGYQTRAAEFATRYLETAGREGEHYSDALELLAAAQAEMFHADRTCKGKAEGSACWLKLSSHASCHIWNSYLQEGETVSWSGECQDGLAQGAGTLTWKRNGGQTESTGHLVDGKMHGRWTVQSPDGIVAEGPFVDGKRHGQWALRSANGDVSEGPYVDGKRHGRWTQRLADGNVVEVPYLNGKQRGRWTLRYPDGRIREGSYVDGKRHGQWTVRLANRGVVEGPYVDDKMHGWWTMRSPDGIVAEGPFVDGKRHGWWTYRVGGQITNRINFKQGVPE